MHLAPSWIQKFLIYTPKITKKSCYETRSYHLTTLKQTNRLRGLSLSILYRSFQWHTFADKLSTVSHKLIFCFFLFLNSIWKDESSWRWWHEPYAAVVARKWNSYRWKMWVKRYRLCLNSNGWVVQSFSLLMILFRKKYVFPSIEWIPDHRMISFHFFPKLAVASAIAFLS